MDSFLTKCNNVLNMAGLSAIGCRDLTVVVAGIYQVISWCNDAALQMGGMYV